MADPLFEQLLQLLSLVACLHVRHERFDKIFVFLQEVHELFVPPSQVSQLESQEGAITVPLS
jgi:hypothetical protein